MILVDYYNTHVIIHVCYTLKEKLIMKAYANIVELVGQMTLEEKAGMCSGEDFWFTKAVERLGIPSIMMTDGPHGLRKQAGEDAVGLMDSVPATCFPSGVGLASTWDTALLHKVGTALGKESKAEGVGIILGPAVNMKRSPLCGRNFEYFSEDPYLAGELAKAHISGVQAQGVGTSIKHFAVNSQEKRRMTVSAEVDERTLREIYLPAFETAVKECQPWTVMNAYNRLNGTYCSEHKELLTGILKEEWGHEGIVITDWGANNDRVAGIKAGQNLEMPGNGGICDRHIVEAVKSGELDEAVLDESVSRVLRVVFNAAELLQSQAQPADLQAHHELARNVAAESMVLLRNERGLLPFPSEGTTAVIGAFAKHPRFQGGGSSHINPAYLDTVLQSMEDRFGEVPYAEGYDLHTGETTPELLEEAVKAAGTAEKVILCIGLPDIYESEGFDREHMQLPQGHTDLLKTILAVQPDTVVVLSNGSPVEMPWIDSADAVIEGYLAGQGGGQALVDIIFGEVNPSGKLAESFPLRLADTPSYINFPGDMKRVAYREGIFIGYRFYEKRSEEVLFPFGHGLSYTDFSYGEISCPDNWRAGSGLLEVSIPITNTGARSGAEVVQLYVKDREASVIRPVKELKGFGKVSLEPGEQKIVSFSLDERSFAFWDVDIHDWRVEAGEFIIYIGSSSADISQSAVITVEPAEPFQPVFDENTMIVELDSHPAGRKFAHKFRDLFIGQFGITEESSAEQTAMVYAMAEELPLRNAVRMTSGAVSESELALLLDIVNNKEPAGRIDEILQAGVSRK